MSRARDDPVGLAGASIVAILLLIGQDETWKVAVAIAILAIAAVRATYVLCRRE